MTHYSGTLRVKEFGTNSASRSARKNGLIQKAEIIEKRVLTEHNALLAEGYIYANGCGRFRKDICTCSKCSKPKPKSYGYWTKERLIEDALKYDSLSEWKNKSSLAYFAAYKKKYLDECAKHMEPMKRRKIKNI